MANSTFSNSIYKSLLLLILLITCTVSLTYGQSFITRWNTENPGMSNASSITIPTIGGGYNYDVDWNNDGVFDQLGINGSVTHDFGGPGIYTIQIRGDFPMIYFNNTGDKDKIIDITQWGNIEWAEMTAAFYGCSNLSSSATDAPDLTNVTDMGSMFQFATKFNGKISTWDVSNVTKMGYMFHSASMFNQNINTWDVSNVTSMFGMFYFATSFNSHLNNWDVSSVIDMSRMFQSATSFNRNISIWHVDNVTNMSYMFSKAVAFNQPIIAWNVSKVTNMLRMFYSANAFNQRLGGWDISSVQNMEHMLTFSGLSTFHYDATLIGWGSQLVQNGVEFGAVNLTFCAGDDARSNLINSFGWTITGDSKSCDFIATWKTDNPGDSPNDAITIPAFGGGYDYDVDWNNDGVYDQLGINGSVSHIYPSSGIYKIRIRGDFPRIYFNDEGDKEKLINIDQWGDVQWSSMSHAFEGCINLNATATDIPDLSNVTDLSFMFRNAETFNGDISNWDVSNISNMAYLFSNAKVFNGDISNWDVSNVTDMSLMFNSTDLFNSDISNWDVSSVTNMYYMFAFTKVFNNDISNWDVSSVTKMNFMFNSALAYNSNMSNWDVSNVTEMRGMFFNTSLFNSDISNWNVSNLVDISFMFKLTDAFNIDISNWDVSYVESMDQVFQDATAFDQNLGQWDVSSVTTMVDMLNGSNLSRDNYDNTLIGWAIQNLEHDVSLGAQGLTYCDGAFSRSLLSAVYNWNITGDTKECDAFITTWKTDNPGVSPNDAITIPVFGGGYNYDVDWNNDGVFDQVGINGSVSHIFSVPGTYTIRIRGDFPKIHFNNSGDKDKLIDIPQWGDIEWASMRQSFYGCSNLNVTATDAPDLSNVTDLSNMFRSASIFNGDLSNWNVSNVVDMSFMFSQADKFTGDLSNWNVYNVTNMEDMFAAMDLFNGDLSNWNVSSVTTMQNMFRNAVAFDQDLGGWDITAITNMSQMLNSTSLSRENYDNTLIGWASQNVNMNVDLGAQDLTYCAGATARTLLINQHNWNITGDLKDCIPFIITWKTDNPGVSPADAFTIPVTGGGYNYDVDWNNDGVYDQLGIVGGVSHIFPVPGTYTIRIRGDFPRIYFNGNGDKNKLIDIVQWGDIKWSNMAHAFEGCSNLTISANDIPDLTNVDELSYMFQNASNFNGDLSNWNVSNVIDMNFMFSGANLFNSDLSNWDVSKVKKMYWMFAQTNAFNSDISNWNVSSLTGMSSMFSNADAFTGDLNNWNVSNVTDMNFLFFETDLFNSALNNWDVSNVDNMLEMFFNATSFNQDLGDWDVSNVLTMKNMLSGSALSTENYDNTLIGWASQNVNMNVDLDALGLTYCLSETQRNLLINDMNWNITGDNLDCGLPVEIIFFDAKVNGKNHVDLQWSTASEINNDYFTIERSRNGIQFEELMKVPGAGNSVQINNYSIEDVDPFAGLSYYRLKQTDFDGSIFYTEIRPVNIDSKNGFRAFPIPMQEVLHVVNNGSINGPVSIEIFDALGKSQYRKQLKLDNEILTLDINEVSNFESGNYFMIVREGDSTQSIKLTKVQD